MVRCCQGQVLYTEGEPVMDPERMAWVAIGVEKNWISKPVCYFHDTFPMSSEEADEDDPCMLVIRLYRSDVEMTQVTADLIGGAE